MALVNGTTPTSALRPSAFGAPQTKRGIAATVDVRVFGAWALFNGSMSISEACLDLSDEPDPSCPVVAERVVNIFKRAGRDREATPVLAAGLGGGVALVVVVTLFFEAPSRRLRLLIWELRPGRGRSSD